MRPRPQTRRRLVGSCWELSLLLSSFSSPLPPCLLPNPYSSPPSLSLFTHHSSLLPSRLTSRQPSGSFTAAPFAPTPRCDMHPPTPNIARLESRTPRSSPPRSAACWSSGQRAVWPRSTSRPRHRMRARGGCLSSGRRAAARPAPRATHTWAGCVGRSEVGLLVHGQADGQRSRKRMLPSKCMFGYPALTPALAPALTPAA